MHLYPSLDQRLKTQHEAIEKLIEGVDESVISVSQQIGKWSVKDIIAHLAKYQPVFTERINLILTTEAPKFERYSADEDPEFEKWRNFSVEKLVSLLKSDREKLYLLISNLSPEELSRIGHHQRFGNLNVVKWTEFFLLHEAHHMFAIFQLVNTNSAKNG
jgi:hypothetical protein